MAVTNKQLQDFEAATARNISAGTILAGYDICFRVEDVVDIAFWQALLGPSIRGKNTKFFPYVRKGSKRITGKSYIMSHSSQANSRYILCVDSDLDYLLDKAGFDAQHYILQTYTYSWENHHCWHPALQSSWVPWQQGTAFDFSAFIPKLSSLIYDAIVLLITKKRLGHRDFNFGTICNILNRIQPNRIVDLRNNGEGILNAIDKGLQRTLKSIPQEPEYEIQKTVKSLCDKGISEDTIYLYMQGHSVYNLICRIGKSLMNASFEYQVLRPSFSVKNEYQELTKIKEDIKSII